MELTARMPTTALVGSGGDKGSSIKVWGTLWAALTALGWLLPNHYYPWIAFHTDAWIASSFLVGSAALMLSSRAPLDWHWLAVVAALLVPIPLLQWAGGLLLFKGHAAIASAFLFGFLLSLLAGARAEKILPERAVQFLLAAIATAAFCSVGLQLWQWLALDGADIWIVPLAAVRPFGNLAQPNQMATFELWGVVCVAWAALKQKVRPGVAVFAAATLLVGVALTQSRTGMAAVLLLLAAAVYWRRLWPQPRMILPVALGLATFYVLCLLSIEPLSLWLHLDKPYNALERIGGGDIRWQVYKMFVDASLQKPWLGYGWTTLSPVQFAVAERHPAFFGSFNQSHNLFLDLVLWIGIPLGGLVSAALVYWFVKAVVRVRNGEDALLLLLVAVVGLHAMLELPLHYAYMLLPTGFVMGVLNTRQQAPVAQWHVGRSVLSAAGLAAALLLGTIVRDYLFIEADFQALRFERAYNMPPGQPPTIYLLDHLREINAVARLAARRGMSTTDLERLKVAAEAFPSPSNMYVYAAALALNGRGADAQQQMRRMAKVLAPPAYAQLGERWLAQSRTHPELATAPWVDVPSP